MTFTPRLCFCVLILWNSAQAQELLQSSTEPKGGSQLENLSQQEDGQRGLKKRRDKTAPIDGDSRSIPEFGPIDDIRVLPQLPKLDPADKPISVLKTIKVKRIELADSTVLANDLFIKIVVPFMDDANGISMEHLQQVRYLLSREYLDRGYINSGVIIPDQKIKNNTIILQSVEGSLIDVSITGTVSLDKRMIKQRILGQVESPLNINQLQGLLRLLQQDPMIQTMGARLRPSETLGRAILDLTITENSPFDIHVGFNNYRSPSVGEENLYFSGKSNNLTGRGDTLTSKFATSRGIDDLSVNYGYPLNYHQAVINTYLTASDSILVEEPFDQIDIESKSTTMGVSYKQYNTRTPSKVISSHYGLDVRHSESTIAKQPNTFSLGSKDGNSDVTVLLYSLNWLERKKDAVWAWNNTIRVGIDAIGATINDGNIPDGEFVVLQSNYQYTTRIELLRSQLSFTLGLQLSDAPLLSLEKYSIGGVRSVRGYRENQFIRDNGYRASVEWRFPLKLAQPTAMSVFVDHALAKDQDEAVTNTTSQSLTGIGFGLFWQPLNDINIEFFVAIGITDVTEPADKALQDRGIHLSIDYKL